jgi:hypothetical protein
MRTFLITDEPEEEMRSSERLKLSRDLRNQFAAHWQEESSKSPAAQLARMLKGVFCFTNPSEAFQQQEVISPYASDLIRELRRVRAQAA